MPPKQKGKKLDLEEFLGDWTEEDNYQPQAASTDLFASVGLAAPAANAPVELPSSGPWTARVSNLSYDAVEDDLRALFTKQSIQSIRMPKNPEGRSRGYAFVEFDDRDSLAAALKLDGQNLQNRAVQIGLEQRRNDYAGGFGGPRGGRFNDEPDLDWGNRRAPTNAPREPRGGRYGGMGGGMGGPGGFDEPDMDWGARRAPTNAPRQPRGPPRSFDEPDMDWGARRAPTNAPRPVREQSSRPPRSFDEPDLDWGARRAPARQPQQKRGGFNVLRGNEDKESPEPAAAQSAEKSKPAAAAPLSQTIAAATATSEQDDSWTTVSKK